MEGRLPESGREVPRLEVPEDVAVLYAWANLQGARYRDFSASRRESRAQTRQRAAQAQREAEALAKLQAEESAAMAERAAGEALEIVQRHEAQAQRSPAEQKSAELEHEQGVRERALERAGELSRRAARERGEAARHAEALRAAEELARREAREVAEAHASAERQARRYAGSEAAFSVALGGEPPIRLGMLSDPYTPRPQAPPARVFPGVPVAEEDMRPERFPQRRAPRTMVPLPELQAGTEPAAEASGDTGLKHPARSTGARESSKLVHAQSESPVGAGAFKPGERSLRDLKQDAVPGQSVPEQLVADSSPSSPLSPVAAKVNPVATKASGEGMALFSSPRQQAEHPEPFVERRSEPRPVLVPAPEERLEPAVPAWIHGQDTTSTDPLQRHERAGSLVANTLQHSRERVASRWYALRGVFDPATPEMEPTQAHARETVSSVLAVFSLAGGVGKTSVTASLGRSLSAVGEKVLLADLTLQGILPFYFGATELRPGVVRTFNPPPGSADAPVSLVNHELSSRADGEGNEEALAKELAGSKERFERVLVDLSPAATTTLKGLARQDAMVLVPVAPDMNTVISLAAMERFFAGMTDSAGRALQPRYLLTQFEASSPLHLDVREGLRQKLGHRLLPFVIRRSSEVSEALAEGMTVIDYAPESGVAGDYRNLASWLRSLAAPAHLETRAARWSER